MALHITTAFLGEIYAHAVAAYPEECCGIGTASENEPDTIRHWYPCVNAQDRFHALDSVRFSRTSRNGYRIAPEELLRITREASLQGEIIRLIVHSHCDAGAYFSEEDERCALIGGEPPYPEADQMVIAVVNGRVREHAVFEWRPGSGFVRCDSDE